MLGITSHGKTSLLEKLAWDNIQRYNPAYLKLFP
jgi:hypothetical protein